MFNSCCLSGRVSSHPTLRYYGKDQPVAEFVLTIWEGSSEWGMMQVSCHGRLAIGAAKHLRHGNRIAVAGFLIGGVYRQNNGTYEREIRLVVSDLEILRDSDIEAELPDS